MLGPQLEILLVFLIDALSIIWGMTIKCAVWRQGSRVDDDFFEKIMLHANANTDESPLSTTMQCMNSYIFMQKKIPTTIVFHKPKTTSNRCLWTIFTYLYLYCLQKNSVICPRVGNLMCTSCMHIYFLWLCIKFLIRISLIHWRISCHCIFSLPHFRCLSESNIIIMQ